MGTNDGFLGLRMLVNKFDAKTHCGLLRGILEVVSPPPIKAANQLETGVEAWEAKLVRLRNRHNVEDLSEELKVAILLSMLPKEYQEKVFEHLVNKENDKEILYIEERISFSL